MEATAAPITNKNRLVMRTTASVTTITIAVAKKKSTAVINSKIKKTAFIIGDSMVKKIDGYLLTSSINHRYIVKVRLSFWQR